MAGSSTPVGSFPEGSSYEIRFSSRPPEFVVATQVAPERVPVEGLVASMSELQQKADDAELLAAERLATIEQLSARLAIAEVGGIRPAEDDLPPASVAYEKEDRGTSGSEILSKAEINRASKQRRTDAMNAILGLVDVNGRFESSNVAGIIKKSLKNQDLEMNNDDWSTARKQLEDFGCVKFEKKSPSSKRSIAVVVDFEAVQLALHNGKFTTESTEQLLAKIGEFTQGVDSNLPKAGDVGQSPGMGGYTMSKRTRRALDLPPNNASNKERSGEVPDFLDGSHRKNRGRKSSVYR